MKRFASFVLASGIGLVADIALALVLHEALALPLWLAAAVSFAVVACLNYLMFELWIFRAPGAGLSALRFGGVLLASAVAGAARVGAVLALQWPAGVVFGTGRLGDTLVLIGAAGVSVVVNFAVNRSVVFSGRTPRQGG